MPRARALAGEFRSVVAESATPRGQAGWNPNHDRVVTAGQQTWLGETEASGPASPGYRLQRCGSGTASSGLWRTGSCSSGAPSCGRTGTLRTPVAGDEQLRSSVRRSGGGGAMKPATEALEHASVKQYCKALRMPVIGANFVPLAEQAVKERRNHIGYLEALLAMESEERDRHAVQTRLHDARLPRMKTLEEFDFNQAPHIPAAKIRELAEGGYIERAEPVVLMGECGTGKTHLATGLCVAACRQKRRVRFTTAANLVNELVEAQQQGGGRRVLARWMRYDLIALDK